MKTTVVLATVLAAALAIPADTYDAKYDSLDPQVLANDVNFLKNTASCIADKGPCSPEGEDFKKLFPEAMRTECAKCTPKQREIARVVVRAFQTKVPELWSELLQKHDPNGEYTESFNKFLNASN